MNEPHVDLEPQVADLCSSTAVLVLWRTPISPSTTRFPNFCWIGPSTDQFNTLTLWVSSSNGKTIRQQSVLYYETKNLARIFFLSPLKMMILETYTAFFWLRKYNAIKSSVHGNKVVHLQGEEKKQTQRQQKQRITILWIVTCHAIRLKCVCAPLCVYDISHVVIIWTAKSLKCINDPHVWYYISGVKWRFTAALGSISTTLKKKYKIKKHLHYHPPVVLLLPRRQSITVDSSYTWHQSRRRFDVIVWLLSRTCSKVQIQSIVDSRS